MTYASFLAMFVLLPLVVVAWRFRSGFSPALLVLLGIVYSAATPWDNLAAATGLWSFDPARISGFTLWHLPIEEYAFFGLQTLLTGVWARARLKAAT